MHPTLEELENAYNQNETLPGIGKVVRMAIQHPLKEWHDDPERIIYHRKRGEVMYIFEVQIEKQENQYPGGNE